MNTIDKLFRIFILTMITILVSIITCSAQGKKGNVKWESKTIHLGTYKSADSLAKAVQATQGKENADSFVDRIIKEKISINKEAKDVDIVILSLADLGFTRRELKNMGRSVYFQDVYDRGKKLGLDTCPAEVIPRLLLQYKKHLKYSFLFFIIKENTYQSFEDNKSLFRWTLYYRYKILDGSGDSLDSADTYRSSSKVRFVFCLKK